MTAAATERQSSCLTVSEVSKSFAGLDVLRSVTFTVPTRTIYGLAGPNGAGKTTLLNIISGFDHADTGRIAVDDAETTKLSARLLNRHGVARTFQNIRLFRGLSVREQVDAGSYRHRRASAFASLVYSPRERRDLAKVREQTDLALEFVGLTGAADRIAETLSYGDQRRVEIARAIAARPRLLLLDEPTAGMNDADWMPIADLLVRLRDEHDTTVVIIEHNMRLLEKYCDRVAVLAAGEVIAEDEPRACLRLPQVRRAYFGK